MNKELLEVRETQAKGLGIFAAKQIPPGRLLFSEAPALVIHKSPSTINTTDIENTLPSLSPEQRSSFNGLSYPTNSHHTTLPARIFFANAFSPSPERACLCLEIARVNHSCHPNAEIAFHPETGHGELFATREISEGQEVCFCYLNEAHCMPGSYRRFMLWLTWRFDCRCEVCAIDVNDDGKDATASDVRREKMYTIRNEIENFSLPVISVKQILRMRILIAETWRQPGELQHILADIWQPLRPPPVQFSLDERIARWEELIGLMAEEGCGGKALAHCYKEMVNLLLIKAEQFAAQSEADGGKRMNVRRLLHDCAERGLSCISNSRSPDHPDVVEFNNLYAKWKTLPYWS